MSVQLDPYAMLHAGFIAFTHEGVLLAYDPLTGRGVKWVTRGGSHGKALQWNPITPGTGQGRTKVRVNDAIQKWHRIVAQHFINGGVPIQRDLEVDHRKHVDGTAAQDILTNLRIVTKRENQQNRKLSLSSSRYAGVRWDNAKGKWLSVAKNPSTGKLQNLGRFTNERKAAQAYIDFCIQHNLPHAPALERLAAA